MYLIPTEKLGNNVKKLATRKMCMDGPWAHLRRSTEIVPKLVDDGGDEDTSLLAPLKTPPLRVVSVSICSGNVAFPSRYCTTCRMLGLAPGEGRHCSCSEASRPPHWGVIMSASARAPNLEAQPGHAPGVYFHTPPPTETSQMQKHLFLVMLFLCRKVSFVVATR